jgi:hypothetical protein
MSTLTAVAPRLSGLVCDMHGWWRSGVVDLVDES